MGRVFTVVFYLDKEQHVAMVAVSNEVTFTTTYNIRILNKKLYHILPGGKLSFTSNDISLPKQLNNTKSIELFINLKSAISNYLMMQPNANNYKQ
jgi:hypothetical protein